MANLLGLYQGRPVVFVRQKVSGNRSYLQIVEGYREDGRVKQRVIATLGRTDKLQETGQLDALL